MTVEYINNKEFEMLILKYLKDQDDEETKTKVTETFYLLADNIIRAFRFKLVDKDDALQEGVLACFSKMDRFDSERGKAFNWFTTIILNHYRQLYRSAKNYNELKRRFLERQIIDKKTAVYAGNSAEYAENISDRIRRNLGQYSIFEWES